MSVSLALRLNYMPTEPERYRAEPTEADIAEAIDNGELNTDLARSPTRVDAPNRAGEGVETKMAGYRAMIKAVDGTDGPWGWMPTTGHSVRRSNLPEPDPDHEHAVEIRFSSREPTHRLRDALILDLRQNPETYEQSSASDLTGFVREPGRRRNPL